MKISYFLLCFSIILSAFVLTGCPDEDPCKDGDCTTPYIFTLSTAFQNLDVGFDNTPSNNPTTVEGVDLGRHLFYDKRLSANNTIACASCHKQEYAFADNVKYSNGFDGGVTLRNSMSISNLRWNNIFFWDGRANTLEQQALMPIQDHIEMGMTLDELVVKLSDIQLYKDKFSEAFGSPEITSEKIAMAISQFERTLISQNSKFDKAYGLSDAKLKELLTAEEYLGMKLFNTHVDPDKYNGTNVPGSITRGANCRDCHGTTLVTNNLITSNGLDSMTTDPGYGKISELKIYDGTFKTPTLRNIALTAPYMHDGRFNTLEEVLDHYDSHVQNHPNLDLQIKLAGNHRPGYLDLTDAEKKAIIAFLHILTDTEFITNPEYADPF